LVQPKLGFLSLLAQSKQHNGCFRLAYFLLRFLGQDTLVQQLLAPRHMRLALLLALASHVDNLLASQRLVCLAFLLDRLKAARLLG
jgi:hypothetical protein